MAQVKSNAEAFTRSWATRIHGNMHSVGELLKESIISQINEDSPPHSRAGEPPHIDVEGRHEMQHPGQPHLVDSWSVQADTQALAVSVVSSVPWSVDTEFGIDMSGERPYAIPALKTLKDDWKQNFLETLLQ